MLAKVPGGAVLGIDGYPVSVEVDVSRGLPSFEIVGLPDAAIREARERVRAALRNSGFEFPVRRITVNLAPAMIRKEGACFDLPIAVGILAATGEIDSARVLDYVFAGELSLDGHVRATPGVLSIALAAKSAGFSRMIVAKENAGEAGLVDGLVVYGARTLAEVAGHLSGYLAIDGVAGVEAEIAAQPDDGLDFADVAGQEHAKRVLEVAAGGGHNVLMVGPPGTGKTMLARRMPTILPPISWEEALEVTRIYSAAGLLASGANIVSRRPFRSPHHTISRAGLVGGGRVPKPGEISLAHRGVLFLDELPEFGARVLEALRQPVEDGFVTVARAGGVATFPSIFCLVGAMNPCPCGKKSSRGADSCTCTPATVRRYLARLSGPLLDRIDIHVEVGQVRTADLDGQAGHETSREMRERVIRARSMQERRFRGLSIRTNAEMRPSEIRTFCGLARDARTLLYTASSRLGLSARAYARALKVARTIADLEGSEEIHSVHMAEAVGYRAVSLRP